MFDERDARCSGRTEHHQIGDNVAHATVVAGAHAGKQRISQLDHGRANASEVQEGMRFPTVLSMFVFVCACGDDGGGGSGTDAPDVPAMITVTGTATEREAGSSTPREGVTVGAYSNSDPNTPVATATTDASGNYTLEIATNGAPLDGYIKASLTGLLDTYLYPPAPLIANYDGASLNMLTQDTLNLLGAVCQEPQIDSMGLVALIVADSAEAPVADAKVSSTPAAAKYCYNGDSLPDSTREMTNVDGTAYILNVPAGEVTVSAMKSGTSFKSNKVNARAGALTTTLIQP